MAESVTCRLADENGHPPCPAGSSAKTRRLLVQGLIGMCTKISLAIIAGVFLLTGCASTATHQSTPSVPAAVIPTNAPTPSAIATATSTSVARVPCLQKVADWKSSPSFQAFAGAISATRKTLTDAQAGDSAATAADLDQLGASGAVMHVQSPPSCSDPQHWWRKMTRAMINAGNQATGVAQGDPAAIQAAIADFTKIAADSKATVVELKNEGLSS